MVKRLALFAMVVACNYGASFHDCTINCSSVSGCPSGFSCNTEGLCRSGETTASCSSLADGGTPFPPDGTSGADSGVHDAGPRDLILSETTSSDVTESAFGCTTVPISDCPQDVVNQYPEGIGWYREFALADFSGAPWFVTGDFQITTVHLGCSSSAANEMIKISIYSDPDPLFGATLDTTSLTQLGSVVATIGPSQVFTCTSDVAIPITVPAIAVGGTFAVAVTATDTVNDNGQQCSITAAFRLGANGSGESRGSYRNGYCAPGAAAPWTDNAAVISVEGTTN